MAILVPSAKPLLLACFLPLLYVLLRALYRISPFHPLAHVPGPLLPRISSLWLVYHAWIGDECTAVHKLHGRYGNIVRTGPNSVDIADGDALNDIYSKGGGFRKTAFYGNFDIDGHKSLFSEIIPENRAPRAKAVLPIFATTSLRAGKERLDRFVNDFVKRCEDEAARSKNSKSAVNVLNLTRGLALDVVTGYLFDRPYGGLSSTTAPSDSGSGSVRNSSDASAHGAACKMSASEMVDFFVSVGRFWYLPSWWFHWVDYCDSKFGLGSSKEVGESLDLVDEYVAGVVDDAQLALEHHKESKVLDHNGVTTASYPARLLLAGLSISETRAQCKDLIFAGTDSTGMNLATILFYLAQNQDLLAKLRVELEQNQDASDLMEIQNLPYLRGAVREGLRLSMANPSRLPRVVPGNGWQFKGTFFPSGTEVSCTPFELHLNPTVFNDPTTFNPERWILEGQTSKQMDRDAIPFGLGSRQCIARNLATAELFLAVKAAVEGRVLEGAKAVGEKIEILEWFNSHVVGGTIKLTWAA